MDTKRICEVLEELPVSRRVLAREAGISPSLLSHICAGKRSATAAVLKALAAALDRLGDRCELAAKELHEAAKEAK